MSYYNEIYRRAGLGKPGSSMQTSFGGIDYRNKGLPISTNTDTMGLVFFTRPRLNLSYHNLTAFPELKSWLDDDPNSMTRAIRCLLDPVGNNESFRKAYMSKFNMLDVDPADKRGLPSTLPLLESNLVDPLNPFIPLLSSNLMNMSGWPDRQLVARTTEEGMRKESMSIPDGVYEVNGVYDFNASFRSLAGDPITSLFNLWCSSISLMRVGTVNAKFHRYLDDVLTKEMPYTTRAYRLVLDSTRRYVRKMAITGSMWPVAINEGGPFDYDRTKNQAEDEVKSVQFSATVARYNEPSIALDFNRLVAMYNPAMRAKDTRFEEGPIMGEAHGYKKLITDADVANYGSKAYPRIKLSTMELELYAPIETKKAT